MFLMTNRTALQSRLLSGSYDTLVIDKDYAVNEVIDGYDAAAVPDNIVANRLDAAGEGLALQINSDGTENCSTRQQ